MLRFSSSESVINTNEAMNEDQVRIHLSTQLEGGNECERDINPEDSEPYIFGNFKSLNDSIDSGRTHPRRLNP